MNALTWLTDSDPAICWQAMHDLTDASSAAIAAERARIPHAGLGAAILGLQQADGSWRHADAPAWSTTLFTLLLLRATGIDRADPAVVSAVNRLYGLRWHNPDGCWNLHSGTLTGTPFFDGEVEPCINGGVLALGGYFGHPSDHLAHQLIGEQLEDGGWNCEAPKSARSSFHTTICVLEGLLAYQHAVGSAPRIAAARRSGEDYLLQRGLLRRRATGEVANPAFLELAFPPSYHYDILRALDYFRSVAVKPDARLREAVQVIESRRLADGRWLLDRAYGEALPFPLSESKGEPSRWNTLRALRVLRWYQQPG